MLVKERENVKSIQLFDITGRLAAEIKAEENSNKFIFSLQEKGSYFMQVMYTNGSVVFDRVIVQ